MRWKLKPKPDFGDTRIITRFLFLPVCINKEYRWLERAKIKRRYSQWFDSDGYSRGEWVNKAWEDKEE